MTSDKHREAARRIMDDACLTETLVKNGTDKCLRDDIAAALTQAEREGFREGMKGAVEIAQAEARRLGRLATEAEIIASAILAEAGEGA